MHKSLIIILLLTMSMMARGQSTSHYCYWIDRDGSTLSTGTTTGQTNISIDANGLSKGHVHSFHFQTWDNSESYSSVVTRYFFIPDTPEEQNTATQARYWFDHNDYTQNHVYWWASWKQHSTTSPWNTTVTNGVIELDISTLSVGLHTLHYQTCSADGTPSSVVTRYLYIPDDNAQLRGIRLWYDDDTENPQTYMANDDEPTVLELDISSLEPGTHTLHVQLLGCEDNVIDEATEEFVVKAAVYITMATTSGAARYAVGYSSDKGLDFTNVTDAKAWIASGYTDRGTVLLSRAKIVPPNTGLYITTDNPGTTVEVPITNDNVLYANLLLPVVEKVTLTRTETIDGVEYTNLIVGTLNGQPAFTLFPATPTAYGPNKSRLRIPSSYIPAAARQSGGFTLEFSDEEASGIDNMNGDGTTLNAIYYDLQGRRTTNGKKGIYISNGKKIIIK